MRDFLIVGPQNACTYKNVFPLLKYGRVAIGENHVNCLEQPDGTVKKFGHIRWYTNIGHGWSGKPLELTKSYNPDNYQQYDNYDAIEVSKVKDIPIDYYGVMGVPVSFLDKYSQEQFEIVGCFNDYKECDNQNGIIAGTRTEYTDKNGNVLHWNGPTVKGTTKYIRILIKRKPEQQ